VTAAMYAVIFCWLVTMAFLFLHDRAHWNRVKVLILEFKEERDSLLDRLMARDFTEFKQADVIEKQLKQPQQGEVRSEEEFGISDVGV